MIQRVGRTGRKRKGNVVALLSEGKERFAYDGSLEQKKLLFEAMKDISFSNEVKLFENNMRMIPDDIIPQVTRENVVVEPLKGTFSPGKRKRKVVDDSEEEEEEDLDLDAIILEDEEEKEAVASPVVENVSIIDQEIQQIGGDDIYHFLVDNDIAMNMDKEETVRPTKVVPTEADFTKLSSYKHEQNEKSKALFKTDGHIDLDKILYSHKSTMKSQPIGALTNRTGSTMKPILSFLKPSTLPQKEIEKDEIPTESPRPLTTSTTQTVSSSTNNPAKRVKQTTTTVDFYDED